MLIWIQFQVYSVEMMTTITCGQILLCIDFYGECSHIVNTVFLFFSVQEVTQTKKGKSKREKTDTDMAESSEKSTSQEGQDVEMTE